MKSIDKLNIELVKTNDVVTAIKQGTQLSILRKKDENELIKIISLIILKFQSSLNIEKKLDDDQVLQCAESIIEEYWGYKIEEFIIFFKKAALGKYGKIYNRLDVMVIFEMLALYDQEREESLFIDHQKAKVQQSIGKAGDVPVFIKKKIDELEKKKEFNYKDPDYLQYKSNLIKNKIL